MIAGDLSRRQFLERLGTFGGLGAAYYAMARCGLLPLARAYAVPPQLDRRIGPDAAELRAPGFASVERDGSRRRPGG